MPPNNIRNGIYPPDSGKYITNFMSDGAAVRITPIGAFCAGDVDRSVAMVNGTTDDILNAVLNNAPDGSFFRHKINRAFDFANSNSNTHEIWMTLHDILWTEQPSIAPEAVTAGCTILKMTQFEFDSSFFYGCNYGGDADTIGEVVGSVCGALHGLSAFPKDWVEKVRFPTGTCLGFTKGMYILDIADQLTELILSEY